MPGVRIVTDSAQDFAPEYLQGLGIVVVPLSVHFGTKTFRDWYDVRGKAFYDMMRASETLPRTSQPSPAAFQKEFDEATADGSSVVCITLSTGLSGTYQSAVLARDMLPTRTIEIVDSKQASCGYGILVLLAQEMAQAGEPAKKIAKEVTALSEKMVTLFSVDTLDYLAKNGRIGRAARFMGTLLNMKPVLGLDKEGYVTAIERVRGKGKVIPTLIEQAEQRAGKREAAAIAICHADCPDDARDLKEEVLKVFNTERLLESEIGAVIGTHVGPGTMALFVVPK